MEEGNPSGQGENMKEKVSYDAPIIEIITIQVEKGFAASSSDDPSLSVSPEWDTIILR